MDYREVLPRDTFLDGKYRIERVLGAGGFGITYEAVDVGLDMPVAIKEYYPTEFALRDQTQTVRPRSEKHRQVFDHLRTSFLREAQTLAQFDDPAIVRVISVFSTHGTAYMVMRYEVGPNLKVWLSQLGRPPTQGELDRILVNLLRALEVMHARDFLHRDIATDNIILRADGDPVLLDFGSSRRVVAEATGTLTGVVKQGFSPPEQYSVDSKGQGPWTDIYALAATLYRCVTGKMPPEGTTRMLEDEYVPARDAAQSSYRTTFLDAIDWALKVYPKDRPQNVSDWWAALFEGTGFDHDAIFSTPNGIVSDPLVVIGTDGQTNPTRNTGRTSRPTGPTSAPRSAPRSAWPRKSEPLASEPRQSGTAGSAPSVPAALAEVPPPRGRSVAARVAVAAVILTAGSFAMIALGSESATQKHAPARRPNFRRWSANHQCRHRNRQAVDAARRGRPAATLGARVAAASGGDRGNRA
ncbi:MAG: serine/threonine-protein kinase [Hyphomicrobiaceae bacterium]